MADPRSPLPDLRLPAQGRLAVYAVSLLAPGLVLAIVILQPWFEPKWMFMDVLTAARESEDCCHATYGLVSQAGLLLWSATAAICLFAALIVHALKAPAALSGFMLFAGLLTGWIVLDDAFLLHESILPGLGLPQNLIQISYVALALVYLFLNRAYVRAGEWALLLGAGLMMAASIGLDLIVESRSAQAVITEDAFKFYGYGLWASYHIATAALLVSRRA